MAHLSAIMENALQESFLYILNRTIGGAFVILAVLIARFLLRRAPRGISFVLWAAVALRLLIPFSIEIDRSPVPVTAQPVPVNIGMMLTPEIDTGIDIIDTSVNGSLPAPKNTLTGVNPMQIVLFAGSVIWAAGVLTVLLADGISLFRLRRRLSGTGAFVCRWSSRFSMELHRTQGHSGVRYGNAGVCGHKLLRQSGRTG